MTHHADPTTTRRVIVAALVILAALAAVMAVIVLLPGQPCAEMDGWRWVTTWPKPEGCP